MNSHAHNFRKEAVDHFNGLRPNSLIIEKPLASKASLLVFVVCFTFLSLIIMLFPHTKKVKIVGVIYPDKGLSRVYPESFGSITGVDINLGDYVNRGDTLISLKPESTDALNERDLANRLEELGSKYLALSNQIENEERKYSSLREIKLLDIKQSAESIKNLNNSLKIIESKISVLKMRLDIYQNNNSNGAVSKVMQEQKLIEFLDAREIENSIKENLGLAYLNEEKLKKEYEKLDFEEAGALTNIEISMHDIRLLIADLRKKNNYEILSPIEGEVIGIESNIGLRVDPTIPIVTILPANSNLSVKLYVPSNAIGFLKVGDTFKIEYSAFPAKDYGYFEGTIKKIGKSIYKVSEISSFVNIPQGDYFICEGDLSPGQMVESDQLFKLSPGMELSAILEGDKKSIFMWLFRPLYELIQRV